MTLAAIESYFTSSMHKPFYTVVGDEEYGRIKVKLEEQGADFIRLSDCCRGIDKKPDLDLLREKLRTADIDCKSNKVAVLGLSEYLTLMGDEYALSVLEELKDFNLGSAWTVFLLRGDNHIIKKMMSNDPRFDNRRCFVSSDSEPINVELLISPTNISMFSINGVKSLLFELENGQSGEISYNSDIPFPNALCRVKEIKDSYEAIRKKQRGFDVPRTIGDDTRWDFLLSEITENGTLNEVFEKHNFTAEIDMKFYSRIAGIADHCWLYYLFLLIGVKEVKNSYLRYVLELSNGFDDFKYNVLNGIINISHSDARFESFYAERKSIVCCYPESDIAQFVVNNRIDMSESIYRLTDNTAVERKEIISWISQYGVPNNIEKVYPELYLYMKKYYFQGDVLSKELTEYFDNYKRQKMANCIDEDFMNVVEQNAVSRVYNRLRTRDELVASIDKENAFLCWIDALGVEYLSYLVEGAKQRGLLVSVKIGRAKLPTITSVNNQFFYDWPTDSREKIETLDEIKHKDKGGYRYGPNNKYPIHLAEELDVLADALDRAATELALRHYDKYVIASDHGASRLAVISNVEEKYETDTRGEHSGRCCKKFENYDLPFATEENDFIVLADYGRFKGSRAANVEVHGGAALEEVIVPVIELTLADNSIQIALADTNIISDFKVGALLCLYVNKSISQALMVHVEGESFVASKVDDNHYKVQVAVMKRAKKYPVDVYVGENLITRFDVTTKGKSASVNSDFDDLF